MAREVLSHLAHLGPNGGRKEEKERRKKKGKRERFRERDPTFSLSFSAIELAVSGGE